MTFSINSKQLLSALNLTAKGLNATTVSDTSNYRFTITDKLRVQTCNLEISMETSVNCEATEPFDILIPGDKLTRLLSSLPDQPLIFTVNGLDVSIKASSGVYELSGYSAELFPVINTETNLECIVPAEDFAEAIYATAFARSTEALLGVFTGLSINITKDKMTFAGCNLMVLSVFNLKGKFKPLNIVLPPGIVGALSGLNMHSDCKISYSTSSICFEYDNLIIKSLLMDENYKDYMGIVPKDNPVKLQADRVQLLSAIKRVLEFSNKEKRINLTDFLTITGEDVAYKQRASESVNAEGGIIDIGVNGQFLAEALARFSSEQVEIHYSAFDKPIIINDPDNQQNFVMIMAMVKI